jgi:hypothetical protein
VCCAASPTALRSRGVARAVIPGQDETNGAGGGVFWSHNVGR